MESIVLGGGDFTAEIWTRGACVNDVRMPDRTGLIASVVLGYASQADRLAGRAYLGELCGPFANRIAAGGFEIDGRTYTPDLNDAGTATLHGGRYGWSHAEWTLDEADRDHARLHLDWSHPDGGFPSPVHAEVEYRLDGWSLTHTVTARADVPSVLSVVSHPYFNLSGGPGPIGDHVLTVPASTYLPIDDASIPLADAPWPVDGTPFDFRAPTRVGDALAGGDPQIAAHGGIDHALILDGTGRRVAARLTHPGTGRELTIETDYPALQVYTGQFLDDPRVAHPEGAGHQHGGIALETEEYPDAPRRGDFPSTLVRPPHTYTRRTTWRFALN